MWMREGWVSTRQQKEGSRACVRERESLPSGTTRWVSMTGCGGRLDGSRDAPGGSWTSSRWTSGLTSCWRMRFARRTPLSCAEALAGPGRPPAGVPVSSSWSTASDAF